MADVSASPAHPLSRQLLVDVSLIAQQDAGTGIQRVVRGTWSGLVKARPDGWDVRPVFATGRACYHYAPPDFLDRTAPLEGEPIAVGPGDVFLGLDLSARLLARHEPQLRQWRRRGVSICPVVYDLLPLTHPAWFNRRTVRYFRRWLATLRRSADRLLCISEEVAAEVTTHWLRPGWFGRGGRRPDVLTFPLGWDIEGSIPSPGKPGGDHAAAEWASVGTTVLMVGTLEPRKGHAEVLAAFERLWAETPDAGPRLLVVGRRGWKTETLQRRLEQHPEEGKRLLWCSSVSDAELLDLYRACTGVVVASRAEGFGLPVAEALINGKPVLVRDLPVFRKFAGPGLTTFERDDPDQWARALTAWLSRVSSAPPPSTPAWAITWEESARALLALLAA